MLQIFSRIILNEVRILFVWRLDFSRLDRYGLWCENWPIVLPCAYKNVIFRLRYEVARGCGKDSLTVMRFLAVVVTRLAPRRLARHSRGFRTSTIRNV